MTIRATFVGVNKHQDSNIPELNGARRDATALWALFTDTIPDLTAQLLVDESATYEAVREGFLQALDRADTTDVVIIFFAGHGTPDGRLVLFDTQTSNLPATAVSMTELAQQFKCSQARVVLCILDCCFSGHAPARVLELGSRPRSAMFGLQEIAGEGRILITACKSDESAWEQPGSGHGLLTHAVIQAMTDKTVTHVNFPEIVGEIIRAARVDAERMGVSQTPGFLGNVEGGLVFPALRPGPNYLTAFPPAVSSRLAGPMAELAACGFAPAIVAQWVAGFPGGLNELQLKAVNEYGVLNGQSLLVVAPTSSGKTMIGELAAMQAVSSGKKAVFLLPYRALVNEKYEDFSARYGNIGLRVVRCSGDFSDGAAAVLAGRYDLGFFTYETFLNLALTNPRLLNQLGLVVVDEAQFITDPHRGITVELIFALLLRARERAITPQLIVLSAVIGNVNAFDRWLGVGLLMSKHRPVPLVEGVLDRTGVFQYLDHDGTTKIEQFLPPHALRQRKEKPGAQDVIVPLVTQLVAKGEKIIVFRNMRGPAQGCAKYLAEDLGLAPAQGVLAALPSQDLSAASSHLRACLAGGTAFHNTNLLREEREAIERGFRDTDGGIHVLASTTTLAAGINTPASTVVLAENEFVGEDDRPFTIAEYKNMAGRAGRLGFNEIGKSIILAETPMERAQLFQRYVLGTPESVRSSFRDEDLPTWTVRLISQVPHVRVNDLPGLLVNTFAGYTASRANPAWLATVSTQLQIFVDRLIQSGLAEIDSEFLHLTLLGRACGASSLSFESTLRLVELLRQINIDNTPAIDLLALVQVLPEMDAVYTPLYKRGVLESARASDVSRRYGPAVSAMLQRYVADQHQFWKRCKRAAITWDWIDGVAIEEIERRYTANPFQGVVNYGDIMRIAENTRFHLRSAQQIIAALVVDKPEWLKAIDQLINRLEFGLPIAALPLAALPVRLTRGQRLSLHRVGLNDLREIATLRVTELTTHLGEQDAARLAPHLEAQANEGVRT